MKALDEFNAGRWVTTSAFSKKAINSALDDILSERLAEGLLVETSTNTMHLIKFIGKDEFEDTKLCFNLSSVIFGSSALNERILQMEPETKIINRGQLETLLFSKALGVQGTFFGRTSNGFIKELKGLKVDPTDISALNAFAISMQERAYPVPDESEVFTVPDEEPQKWTKGKKK